MKKRLKNLGSVKSGHDPDSLVAEFSPKAIFKKIPQGIFDLASL